MAPVATSSGPEMLAATNHDGTNVTFVEANWPFVAWAAALFGSGVLVARAHTIDAHWYARLALVMYLFHQSEEHAYDLRGWRYAFVPSLNQGIGRSLFSSLCTAGQANCPVDPKVALYINTIMIWVGFGGCILAASANPERFLLAGSLCWGTAVVNGVGGHVLPAVASASYNPGLAQSLVMVPLGVYIIRQSRRPWLCLTNGLVAHVVGLGMGINLMHRAHLPEAATTIFFNLVAGLFLPLVLSSCVRPHMSDTMKQV